MRQRRKHACDRIAGADETCLKNDAHDTRAVTNRGTGCRFHLALQAGLEAIHLDAGLTKAGEFYDCLGTELEACALREREQVDAAGQDVFSYFAGIDPELPCGKFLEEFGLQKMDLHVVGSAGISAF